AAREGSPGARGMAGERLAAPLEPQGVRAADGEDARVALHRPDGATRALGERRALREGGLPLPQREQDLPGRDAALDEVEACRREVLHVLERVLGQAPRALEVAAHQVRERRHTALDAIGAILLAALGERAALLIERERLVGAALGDPAQSPAGRGPD